MTIQTGAIEAAAPDQASLKAALGLAAPGRWSDRQGSADNGLIWGACQGSGANPYRTVVDLSDLGAKCTCPSRKFPCKHALALMLLYSRGAADFAPAPVPDWVGEWLGRRRKDTAPKVAADGATGPKSLSEAAADTAAAPDPAQEAKREALREKRAGETRASVSGGLEEMEGWIADQLRTGLSGLLADLTARCRRIAARLVDAKAAVLAARIDMIPARVLALPQAMRGDALIAELGKLVILSRAWQGGAAGPDVWREIVSAETREALIADPAALRHNGIWEVLATREEARRDGLIQRSTWLLGIDAESPRFALLLDFFPASTGRQGAAFDTGTQFRGELVFYPGAWPLRAQILTRETLEEPQPWPQSPPDSLDGYARAVTAQPWVTELPLLLPPGRFAQPGNGQAGDQPGAPLWWQGGDEALPVAAETVARVLRGTALSGAVVLWNASRATLLAADTALGRHHAEG